MSNLPQLIHDGVLTAGAASALYAITVTITAMIAVLSPTAARRRDAREALKILLRRRNPK
ncbi:MAG TPA: hypothetical protein VM347_43665 [Nonomuraea sp.]|nr:hypothetical protein [Nonomuraea sp.]